MLMCFALPCPSCESSNRDISTAQGILVGQAAWDLCNASFASKGIEKKKDGSRAADFAFASGAR